MIFNIWEYIYIYIYICIAHVHTCRPKTPVFYHFPNKCPAFTGYGAAGTSGCRRAGAMGNCRSFQCNLIMVNPDANGSVFLTTRLNSISYHC